MGRRLETMKLLLSLVVASSAHLCDWVSGESGEFVTCPVGQWMTGVCESIGGKNKRDCTHSSGQKVSHQVKCCTDEAHADLGQRDEKSCRYRYATASNKVECRPDRAEIAIARCSSSMEKSESKNHCCEPGKPSQCHAMFIECCKHEGTALSVSSCKWHYGQAGDNLECADGTYAEGFCGNTFEAKQCNFNPDVAVGIRCCEKMPGFDTTTADVTATTPAPTTTTTHQDGSTPSRATTTTASTTERTLTTTEEGPCSEWSTAPIWGDCESYLICKDGKWERGHCPDGQWYDGYDCDWIEFVDRDCQGETTPRLTTTEKTTTTTQSAVCTDGDKDIIPDVCGSYMICVNGQWEEKACYDGQWFDGKRCDWPEYVDRDDCEE